MNPLAPIGSTTLPVLAPAADEPCASLPAVPPGRARARRGNCCRPRPHAALRLYGTRLKVDGLLAIRTQSWKPRPELIVRQTPRWREVDSNFPFRAVNEHRTAPR